MLAFRIYRHAVFLNQVELFSVSLCIPPPVSLCFAVTPQDYQPPGFMESDSDNLVFEKEPVKLTMGKVVTPYHILKLDVATERQRLEQVNDRVTNDSS